MESCQSQIEFPKAGVSFEEAASVFYDPLAVTGADPDHSEVEERMITFGMLSQGRLLVVAHTEHDDAIHIISARVTTQRERHIYEES